MQKIKLCNSIVLIDDEDYDSISSQTWYKNETSFVNQDRVPIGNFILGYEGPLIVDHKDRNFRNNQKENLRLATHQQNCANQGPKRGKYKGVSFHKGTGKFQVHLQSGEEKVYIGIFTSEVRAAKAYDELAKQYFGEFAYINFPEENKCRL